MTILPNPNLPDPNILSVSALNQKIKWLLESEWLQLEVYGEVSNLVKAQSGHCYFSLKDQHASIRCVIFKGQCSQYPDNGQAIQLKGQLSFYAPRGDCQIIGSYWQPKGQGGLQAELKKRFARCDALGLFDASLKKRLPAYPEHIVIVTAAQSAAYQDVLKVHRKRFPLCNTSIQSCLVQGSSAPSSIKQALIQADEMNADVILLCRGGGSLEDLWCFNDENLIHLMAKLKTPIITGIGHEVDSTLADFVADATEATPTAAMERLLPDQHDCMQYLDHYQRQLLRLVNHIIDQQRWHLSKTNNRLALKTLIEPLNWNTLNNIKRMQAAIKQLMHDHHQRHLTITQKLRLLTPRLQPLLLELQQGNTRLKQACDQTINQQQQQLSIHINTLKTLSPHACFERGYAMIAQDTLISSIHQMNTDQPFKLALKDGDINVIDYEIS